MGLCGNYGIMCAMRPLRNFKTNQCCHLISRIANRAFFLNDEEKTVLMNMAGYISLENLGSLHSPRQRYRLLAKGRCVVR